MDGVSKQAPAPSHDAEHRSRTRGKARRPSTGTREFAPARARREAQGETARLADALNGIGCADERPHMDVWAGKRSMDGCLQVSSQANRTLARPSCRRNGFGYFCRNKSSPLALGERKRHGCRSLFDESSALSARHPNPALRATFSRKREKEYF